MKKYVLVVLMLVMGMIASAQTITSTSGSIQVGMQDSSGGSYIITIPVGSASVVYTAPPPPSLISSVVVACPPTVNTGVVAQCTATVSGSGSYNGAVSWSASSGSVSSGTFSSPTAGAATITAVSMQDPSKSGNSVITVVAPGNGSPAIPANAIAADLVNPTTPWKACVHDAGTPGTATCSNNFPVTGIFSDDARAFGMTYTAGGGVRWADSFAKDTLATNFVFDTVVLSPDWTHVANLELDTNQVKADGRTTILGTQCSTYSKTWEVTLIAPQTNWHWVPTNVPCNTPTWTPNVPHHIRIFGTISTTGVSTYLGVEFDGVYSAFTNQMGTTAEALGWGVGTVLENFQVDGLSTSGSATVYVDRLTIYRW